MQKILMKFDPATGKERPYPSHAAQWRNWHGVAAWLFDPWTGKRRNAYDVGSDVHGLLIVPAGTLGGDTGCGASKQNKHEAGNDAQRPPTPVGWSDTDWIKHLQEQEGQHPLEGLHINQGSLDAAADAYEAEYNEAQKERDERSAMRKSEGRQGGMMDVIDELIAYCEAWEPWARVMGNVCAGDAAQALRSLRAELAELRRFRKAIMDYDSNLYDALADSDACMTPEEIARARLCLRCGVPFKERGVGCSYMGVDYGRHLWPKTEGLNND